MQRIEMFGFRDAKSKTVPNDAFLTIANRPPRLYKDSPQRLVVFS